MSGPLLVLTIAPLVLAIEDAKTMPQTATLSEVARRLRFAQALEMPAERAVSICTPCLCLG